MQVRLNLGEDLGRYIFITLTMLSRVIFFGTTISFTEVSTASYCAKSWSCPRFRRLRLYQATKLWYLLIKMYHTGETPAADTGVWKIVPYDVGGTDQQPSLPEPTTNKSDPSHMTEQEHWKTCLVLWTIQWWQVNDYHTVLGGVWLQQCIVCKCCLPKSPFRSSGRCFGCDLRLGWQSYICVWILLIRSGNTSGTTSTYRSARKSGPEVGPCNLALCSQYRLVRQIQLVPVKKCSGS